MNNLKLTRGLELVNAQATDLSSRLATAVPDIYYNMSDTDSNIIRMCKAVKDEANNMLQGFDSMKQRDDALRTEAGQRYETLSNLAITSLQNIDELSNTSSTLH